LVASFTVFPLDDERKQWLINKGIDVPNDLGQGRNPTLHELRSALEDLDDHDVDYTISPISWQAHVSDMQGRWASLVVLDRTKPENVEEEPVRFYFENGWEEVIKRVLKSLSLICGPLIFFSNVEMEPMLVLPPTQTNDDEIS
jgi:hypothetical protein